MPTIANWTDLGVFPLQDHEPEVLLGRRQQLAGARFASFSDTDGAGGVKDSMAVVAQEDGMGTIGDLGPWLFWQTADREERDTGLWTMAIAALVVEGEGALDPTRTTTATPKATGLLAVGGFEYGADGRLKVKQPLNPTGLSTIPKGTLMLVVPSTSEPIQQDLMLHTDSRLIAPAAAGPASAGTLICDLGPENEICMGAGSRHNRVSPLQTFLRVIPHAEGNPIAWNLDVSAQGTIANYGMCWAEMEGDSGGPATGGKSTAGAARGSGQTVSGPATGVRSRGQAVAEGGPESGSGLHDDDGKRPIDFGQLIQEQTPNMGCATMSASAGGPFHAGHVKDKHRLSVDLDGNPINSGHLATGALFYRNQVFDGPLLFEGVYPGAGGFPLKSQVHLDFDMSMGVWRWWAEIPFYSPESEGEPDPDGGGGTTTGGPGRGGRGTPGSPSGPGGGSGSGGPSSPPGQVHGGPGGPGGPGGAGGPSTPTRAQRAAGYPIPAPSHPEWYGPRWPVIGPPPPPQPGGASGPNTGTGGGAQGNGSAGGPDGGGGGKGGGGSGGPPPGGWGPSGLPGGFVPPPLGWGRHGHSGYVPPPPPPPPPPGSGPSSPGNTPGSGSGGKEPGAGGGSGGDNPSGGGGRRGDPGNRRDAGDTRPVDQHLGESDEDYAKRKELERREKEAEAKKKQKDFERRARKMARKKRFQENKRRRELKKLREENARIREELEAEKKKEAESARSVGDVSGMKSLHTISVPQMLGVTALTFRPQRWVPNEVSHIHDAHGDPEIIAYDEQTRPQVLAAHAFGGVHPGTEEWAYVEGETPEVARSRGGMARGGLMLVNPNKEPEDYFGLSAGSELDVEVGGESTVLLTPGVTMSFGLPANASGDLDAKAITLSQASMKASMSPLQIHQLDASQVSQTLLSVGIGDVSGEILTTFGGVNSVTLPAGTTAQRRSVPAAGDFRTNTDAGAGEDLLEHWDDQNSAWRTVLNDAAPYLKLDGTSAMTGNLNLGGNIATNSGVVVGVSDLMNVGQLLGTFVPVTGGTYIGDVSHNDNVASNYGTGNDAEIYYDGTNLVINPTVAGTGGVLIPTNDELRFGTNATHGKIEFDGSNLYITPRNTSGSAQLVLNGYLKLNDNKQLRLGSASDAQIYYDGTDLIVNPDAVGSGSAIVEGDLAVLGTVAATGGYSVSADTGITSTIVFSDFDEAVHTVTVTGGIITGWSTA